MTKIALDNIQMEELPEIIKEIFDVIDASVSREYCTQMKRQVGELEEKVVSLQESSWMFHRDSEEHEELPVPRLQIRLVTHQLDLSSLVDLRWYYELITRHYMGGLIAIPMGETSTKGYESDIDNYFQGKYIILPHRDGAHLYHDMSHLNLPGFVIYNDNVNEIKPGSDPYRRGDADTIKRQFKLKSNTKEDPA
jgi:hypothetical protein